MGGQHGVNVYLEEVLVSAKQLRNVCQIHTDIHVLQGGTSDSVIAVWLICCLNCYQLSWPNCSFFVPTCSHSSNHYLLSQPFVTKGRPGRLKSTEKTGRGHSRVCQGKTP